MKLDLSKQESRLPLVEIPEDNKQRIRELDGEFLNLYKIIGHNPTMLTGWIEFAYSLRRDCTTPRTLRELMILRGAQLCNSAYEWHQHKRMARKCGVPHAQVEDLMMWRESPRYSDPERAALAFTEAMMAGDTSRRGVRRAEEAFQPERDHRARADRRLLRDGAALSQRAAHPDRAGNAGPAGGAGAKSA